MDNVLLDHLKIPEKRYYTRETVDRFYHEKIRDGKWTKKSETFYKSHLDAFKKVAPEHLDEITKDFVLDYVYEVGKGKKGKPAPVMKEASFNCIRIFLAWCEEEGQGYIIKSPIPRKFKLGSPPKTVRKLPTKDDLALILKHWKKQGIYFPAVRNYALLMLYANTGCRLSELLADSSNDRKGLLDNCIDWNNGTIKVFGKGERERIVYADDNTLNAMELYKKLVYKRWPKKSTPTFWLTEEGRPLQGNGFRLAFTRACKELGLKFTPHDWRRYFCTTIANSGVNDTLGMEATGHHSHDMYRHYITVNPESVRNEIRKHSPVAGL